MERGEETRDAEREQEYQYQYFLTAQLGVSGSEIRYPINDGGDFLRPLQGYLVKRSTSTAQWNEVSYGCFRPYRCGALCIYDNTLFDTVGGDHCSSREHRAVVFESHRLLLGTRVRQHHRQPLAPSEG
jgi:hypothetical protein